MSRSQRPRPSARQVGERGLAFDATGDARSVANGAAARICSFAVGLACVGAASLLRGPSAFADDEPTRLGRASFAEAASAAKAESSATADEGVVAQLGAAAPHSGATLASPRTAK
jgi:hypothetical protein